MGTIVLYFITYIQLIFVNHIFINTRKFYFQFFLVINLYTVINYILLFTVITIANFTVKIY